MKATRTDIYQQLQTTNQLLQAILGSLQSISIQQSQQGAAMATNANNLSGAIQNLTAEVANQTTVNQSAIALINGFAANATAAIQAAQNGGDFAPLNALVDTMRTNAGNLATAVAQNTAAEQELERLAGQQQQAAPASGGQAPTPSPADGSAPAATTAPADAGAGAAPASDAGTAPADATGTSTASAPADTGTPAPPTGAGGGGAQG